MSAPPSGPYKSAASRRALFPCKHRALAEHLSQPQLRISTRNEFYQSSIRVLREGAKVSAIFPEVEVDLTPTEAADWSLCSRLSLRSLRTWSTFLSVAAIWNPPPGPALQP